MLNRFVELETTVKATLAIIDVDLHILSSEEWKICKELCLVLKPFDEVTKLVSGENYMCASMVIVLSKGLADVCEKLKNKPFESSVKGTIKVLQDGIDYRFSDLEMSNTLRMATFLDPKFKHYALTKSLEDQTKTKAINAVAQHIRNNSYNTETLPAVPVEERDEC